MKYALLTVFCYLNFQNFALSLVSGEDRNSLKDSVVIEGKEGPIQVEVDEDVILLNNENFDKVVNELNIVLVEFYAPWCGHCRALAPEYTQAAKLLKTDAIPVTLAKVDATVETALASQFEISGYPTLYVFRKGVQSLYDGPRSKMGIVEYMREQADPTWKPTPEAVVVLTSSNFTKFINDADIILVEFYAPWCGHCKRLAPEYERAAKILRKLPSPIPLAKVDGTTEKNLADTYQIHGWPSLLIFRKGQIYNYEGPRDEAGIVSYMKEEAKPASIEKNNSRDLKNAFSKIDVTVVGFFKNQDEALYKAYLEAANIFRRKLTFLHTFSSHLSTQFNIPQGKIVVFQPEIYKSEFELSHYEYFKAAGTTMDIKKFFEDAIPLVGLRTHQNMWKYQNKYPLVVVYYDADFGFENRVQTQMIRNEILKVAKDFKGMVTFSISNEDEFQEELINLGLEDSGEAVNVGFYDSAKVRYQMEPTENFSAHKLRNFVDLVQAGKVPQHIKSQPAPKDSGSLVTVVGSTFNKLIEENMNNVLIEFYAPWCGHCQALEPVYKKLAKKFSNNKNIMIAKIDATANDFPEKYDIKGFPTIIYVQNFDKKLIYYDGERKLSDLVTFVNRQLENVEDTETERDEL